MIGLALAAEPGDEVAEGTVGETELARDVGQRTPLQEVGAQGLVVPLLGLTGLAEELLTA